MTTRAERVSVWKQNRVARLAAYREQRQQTEALIAGDQPAARAAIAAAVSQKVRKPRERKRVWTAGEITILRELAAQGSTPEEVAEAMRRPMAEIQKKALTLSLWELTDKRPTGVTVSTSSVYFTGQKSSRRPT